MSSSLKRWVIGTAGSSFRDCAVFSSMGVVIASASRVVIGWLREQIAAAAKAFE